MVVLKEVPDISRYGTVKIDYNGKVTGFSGKGKNKGKGFVNGGVYYINKAFFESFDFPEKFSFEKDFLEKYYPEYEFHGMVCNQYFLDIGVPEDYKKAQDDFKEFEH
jgi:D-glycero-alpha-D-manno-heptose 1-phosphate guanylyltransferase